MDGIVFLYYNKKGTVLTWLTLPRAAFSTENFQKEIEEALNKYAPENYHFCTVNEGWLYSTNGKDRKDT